MNIKFDVMNETRKASLMSRIIIGIMALIMFSLNVYFYIWNPLEKHYDLNKIVFGWLIVLFILNYLFRHSKCWKIGYVISIILLALAYFIIPM